MSTKKETVFNKDKTIEEYAKYDLFFNGDPGLLNTVHRKYPKNFELYKEMKSLDWSEDEFDYSKCFLDFKNVNKDMSNMMLETIMFQYEADSIAGQYPFTLIAPFQPCMEVLASELAINTNELVHAFTYSEIIRLSFDNPEEVLQDMLAKTDTFERMELVNTRLAEFQRLSTTYAYYQTCKSQEELEQFEAENKLELPGQLIVFYFIMFLLERIQFMASFAITFTICKQGPFQPIGQAVKKIAQDELEVHSEHRKEVLKVLIREHPEAFAHVKDNLIDLYTAVVESELEWTDKLFHNRSLSGTNAELIKSWVLYNAKAVANFIGIINETSQYAYPESNPIPFLADWFNMNSTQTAPQEIDSPAYKLGVMTRDDDDEIFDI